MLSTKIAPPVAPEDICVIALDTQAENYCIIDPVFKQLSVAEKIKKIMATASKAYEEAKCKTGAKLIIISLCEYAITEEKRRSISTADKNSLKASLRELTKDKPDLIMISGAVLIRKEIIMTPKKKAALKSYYEAHEKKGTIDELVKAQEIKTIDSIASYPEGMVQLFGALGIQPTTVKYKNSLFIAYHGDIVARIGKAAVYFETDEEPGKKGIVQPAKGRNLMRVIIVNGYTIGFEICLDHGIGALKKSK